MAAASLAFLVVVARVAWIGDDAQITFRVAENVLAGRGPRWNVAERVQVFTHPLWLGVVVAARALRGEYYDSVLTVSVALATAAAAGVGLRARSTTGAVLAIGVLAASKSVVEYATSGLENPLAYLLLVLLLDVRTRRPDAVLATSLLTSALALTRLDLLLVAGPALAAAVATAGRRGVARAVAGLLPLGGWSAFALVYYGSTLPNTALAKLGHGLPRSVLDAGARAAFAWQAGHDPLSLAALTGGALVAAWRGPRSLAVGLVAYVAYLGWIGGDFMGGRFLAAPTVLAVGVLATHAPGPRSSWVAVLGLVGLAAAGGLPDDGPLRTALEVRRVRPPAPALEDVVDERRWYVAAQRDFQRRPRPHAPREITEPAAVFGAIGQHALDVGPWTHVLDPMALADPFLARLPAIARDPRPGHYARHVPLGYLETEATGAPCLLDPGLQRLRDRVALVARGPLFAPERWAAIVDLATGRALPSDLGRWALPSYDRVPVALLHAENLPLFAPDRGTTLALPSRRHPRTISVGLGPAATWEARLLRDGVEQARVSLRVPPRDAGARFDWVPTTIDVPGPVRLGGVDAIELHADGPAVERLIGEVLVDGAAP